MGDRSFYRYYARLSGAAFLKVILAATGYGMGQVLDKHLDTSPYVAYLGMLTGAGIGLWWLVRIADKE